MEYSINKFFEKSECDDIIEFAEEVGFPFSYTKDKSGWDCKRIHDAQFTHTIKQRFVDGYNNNTFKLWLPLQEFDIKDINISLTKYYDGRWLDLHLDMSSQLTTVIVLSDGFSDGRFMLSENNRLLNGATQAIPPLGSVPSSKVDDSLKIQINKGECISFDGSKIYHGVLPVTEGTRFALNIWMTNTNYKFLQIDKKTLV